MLCYSAQFWTSCVPVLLSSAWFCAVLLGSARFCAVLRNVLRFCVGSARFCAVLLDVLPILSVLRCSALFCWMFCGSAEVLRCSAECSAKFSVLRRFCAIFASFPNGTDHFFSLFRFCDPVTVP